MKNLKLIIICFLLILPCFVSYSQTFTAQYTYDANGNRVTATVIYLKQQQLLDTLKQPNTIQDSLQGLKINVYPNPTKGNLLVEIINDNSDFFEKNSKIHVVDITGKIIYQLSPLSTNNVIDLSGEPNGIYILMIYSAGKDKYFKIIKE